MKKIQEILIKTGLKIAKRGEGALFVVGECKYKPLIKQTIKPFKAHDNLKLLESIALIDGAVIIDYNGYVKAYGVKILGNKIMQGFGTRNSAGLNASSHNKKNLVILVSEEEKKVKVFKEGKIIMQIDALQKNVEKSIPKAVNLLESVGFGAVSTIGAGMLIPSLGISIIPGIIIFSGSYYLIKSLIKSK